VSNDSLGASSADLDAMPPHLSLVIPAYNEEARIGSALAEMLAYLEAQSFDYEVLVVDDGSTDGTRALVEGVGQTNPRIQVLHYDANRGKGFAVRYGMTRATGNFVLFCDADHATPIEMLEPLMAAVRAGADVAIGSRDVKGSVLDRHQGILRENAGKAFNLMVRLLAVPGIHDTQCGFKLFTQAAARNIFSRCQVDNFSFDVEALYLARQLGYSIAEVPVHWHHVEGSKVRALRDGTRMVRTIFRIRATDYQIRKADVKRISAP
jgi:dolichyl-phosphate beta-glucosyltransferase